MINLKKSIKLVSKFISTNRQRIGALSSAIILSMTVNINSFLNLFGNKNLSSKHQIENIDLNYNTPPKTNNDQECDSPAISEETIKHCNSELAASTTDEIETFYCKYTIKDLPKFYRTQLNRLFQDSCFLKDILYLEIEINNSDDITWISECTSLRHLKISLIEEIDENKMLYLSNLNSLNVLEIYSLDKPYYSQILYLISTLENIQGLAIHSTRDYFVNSDIDFINSILGFDKLLIFAFEGKYVNEFSYYANNQENEYILRLNHLYTQGFNKKIKKVNIIKCYNLESLIMLYSIDELKGIQIDDKDVVHTFDEIREMYRKIDEIYEKLDIKEEDSDEEKVHKILYYIVTAYTYEKRDNNYEHGWLGDTLENAKIVCGNYAAIFQALAHKANLNSIIIHGGNHAWNIVQIEGKNYIVDPTWIDGDFDSLNSLSLGLVDKNFLLYLSEFIHRDKFSIDSHEMPNSPYIKIEVSTDILNSLIQLEVLMITIEWLREYYNVKKYDIENIHRLEQKKKRY